MVEVLSLLVRVYDIIAKGKQGTAQSLLIEKKEEAMKKISYLDPKAAFKL